MRSRSVAGYSRRDWVVKSSGTCRGIFKVRVATAYSHSRPSRWAKDWRIHCRDLSGLSKITYPQKDCSWRAEPGCIDQEYLDHSSLSCFSQNLQWSRTLNWLGAYQRLYHLLKPCSDIVEPRHGDSSGTAIRALKLYPGPGGLG
jgi:hypothetical protein